MNKIPDTIDNLKKWNYLSKVNVKGVKVPVTILHNDPLPPMNMLIDKSDEEIKKNYEKRRISDWIKNHSKEEYELNDGQNTKIKIYFPEHPVTGEKRASLWIEDTKYGSITKSNYIQIRLKLDIWFGLNNFVSQKDESKLALNVIKEKYGIELLLLLSEKDTITLDEFINKLNLKENKSSSKHLNKFVEIGLLEVHRYNKGATKIFKSTIREEKLREIANLFQ